MIGWENDSRDIFGRISIGYDRMSNIQTYGRHRAWKRHLVDEVYENGCGEIIDVCCGTGDVTLQIAQLPAVKRIAGVDFSDEMLSIARGRAAFAEPRDGHFTEPEFILCDAEELPFEDESFDCAVISFGLASALSPPDIVREMHRVLRPGGLFVCLDVCRPVKPLQKAAFSLQYGAIVQLMAGDLRQDYKWIADAMKGFYTIEELKILLEQVKFENIFQWTYQGGLAAMHVAKKAVAGQNA